MKSAPPEPARDLVPWACVVVATLFAFALPILDLRIPVELQLLPWVVGLLFFGLPHGACDHLVAAKLTGRTSGSDAAAFFAVYLSAVVATVVLWFVVPTIALAAFLALTALHWGAADAMVRHRDGIPAYALASVARGTLVVSAPAAMHPVETWEFLSALTSVFGESYGQAPAWFWPFMVSCLTLSLLAETSLVIRNIWRGDRRAAVSEGVETILLLGLFWSVTPVAAVGVYFVCWHAWRHVIRAGELLRTDKETGVPGTSSLVLGYHVKALPLTLVSLVMLVVLGLVSSRFGAPTLIGVYLVLISALTVPHAILVFLWDLRLLGDSRRTSIP